MIAGGVILPAASVPSLPATDGKTHMFLSQTNVSGLSNTFCFTKQGTCTLRFDFGDGTFTESASAAQFSKTYEKPVNYHATVEVSGGTGTYAIGGASGSLVVVGGGTAALRGTLWKLVTANNVTTITYAGCFQSYALKEVVLSQATTTIGSLAFSGVTGILKFTCLAAVPPAIAGDSLPAFLSGARIFVPDGSVGAYKAATNWINYANYIYPLSQYEN